MLHIGNEIQDTQNKALSYLLEKFRSENVGDFLVYGWHQYLDETEIVGIVATVQATLILKFSNKLDDPEIRSKIRKSLISITRLQRSDGGWAYKTNLNNVSTTEPTAWAIRCLCEFNSYDGLSAEEQDSILNCIEKGVSWLIDNANGKSWGSQKEDQSRVYFTCLAVQALNEVCVNNIRISNKYYKEIQNYITFSLEWIMGAKNNSDDCWGDSTGKPSSYFHTAYVLYTIYKLGKLQNYNLSRAHDFLLSGYNNASFWHDIRNERSGQSETIRIGDRRVTHYHSVDAWVAISLLSIDTSFDMKIIEEVVYSLLKEGKENHGKWKHKLCPDYFTSWALYDTLLCFNTYISKVFCKFEPYKKIEIQDYQNIHLGIITALPHEYAAMEALIEDGGEISLSNTVAGSRYLVGNIPSKDGAYHKVVLALCDMGNNKAAIRAERLLSHFPNITSIIMTGIAGGVPNPKSPDEHVRLGDIVVSNQKGITQYDFVKETLEDTTIRSNSISPSSYLLEAVNFLRVEEVKHIYPWEKFIPKASHVLKTERPANKFDKLHSSTESKVIRHPKDVKRRSGMPRVFLGPIASSNTLLKNPQKRDKLRDLFGVKAIEMEASGIADATWNHGKGYLVVRGICDYCDAHKNDLWQNYAAAVAAAYTRALISSIPSIS